MSLGKFRCGRERYPEIRQRFDRPVEAAQRVTAIGQDLRMTGQACERFVVVRHRLDRLVQSQQRIAAVDESADVTRRDRQHAIVIRQRVVDMIERQTGVAEIVEDLRMVGRQIERMAIAQDGFVVTPGRMKRQPEIRQRIGGTRIDLERLRQEAERLDQTMTPEVKHSEQMQRIEIIGPVRQDPGTQLFRPVELALLKGIVSLPLQARQVRHSSRVLFPIRRQRKIFPQKRPSRNPSEELRHHPGANGSLSKSANAEHASIFRVHSPGARYDRPRIQGPDRFLFQDMSGI